MFDDQRKRVQKWMAGIGGRRGSTKIDEITFGFIDNDGVNAVADVMNRREYIGMFKGFPLSLLDTFYRLLAHPGVLPKLGCSGAEIQNEQHREGVGRNFGQLIESRRLSGAAVNTIAPRDLSRQVFAQLAARVASDFILMHEFAHIIHGHLSYLDRQFGSSRLPEVQPAPSSSGARYQLTRQTLEMDADRMAVAATLNCAIQLPRSKSCPDVVKRLLSNDQSAAFLWSFAVAGLFYVWGLEKVDVDKLHPPFVTRFQMISSEASRVMKRDFPNSAKKFLSTFLSALRAMDASVRLVGDSLSPSQRIAVAAAITSDWAEAYRKELTDHCKEIRADMRSLSRVGTRRAD